MSETKLCIISNLVMKMCNLYIYHGKNTKNTKFSQFIAFKDCIAIGQLKFISVTIIQITKLLSYISDL